ncbi:biotin transporter BioY [Clostridium sp. SYSU_GA19001]|uniref:biotin transporter BioY n=1 Tax=Clostridium caldaquaticum TaxID=2940653 RepID=UPI002077493C|nr:biotin transporter BioY [Clostridium caldaquaticum]MCM8711176.1 biotin transporter BioY [Clostridium caldaquaticum]
MKINTKQMILAALFAALTAAGAFIQIPLGTVPITLQFLFTALAGVLLGARLGALSQLIYVIIGLMGVPVFAGGTGGISTITSKSFGYLLGFILGSYVIGKIAEGSTRPSFIRLFAATLVGIAVIYAIGVPYLFLISKYVIGKAIPFNLALKFGFYVFIPGDLLKCILAAALGVKIIPRIQQVFA